MDTRPINLSCWANLRNLAKIITITSHLIFEPPRLECLCLSVISIPSCPRLQRKSQRNANLELPHTNDSSKISLVGIKIFKTLHCAFTQGMPGRAEQGKKWYLTGIRTSFQEVHHNCREDACPLAPIDDRMIIPFHPKALERQGHIQSTSAE